MKSIILSLLLIPNICFGDVVLHLHAYHPTNEYLNNDVYGIGYNSEGYVAGMYHNSWKNTSIYLMKEENINGNISYFYGGATGYSKIIIPIGGINISYKSLILTLTPPIGDYASTALMLSVKLHYPHK